MEARTRRRSIILIRSCYPRFREPLALLDRYHFPENDDDDENTNGLDGDMIEDSEEETTLIPAPADATGADPLAEMRAGIFAAVAEQKNAPAIENRRQYI